jgi:hypothetical protein
VPYLNVMTRIEERTDDTLLYDLGGREHPTMLFLDAEGGILGWHDTADCTVPALEATAAKVRRSLELAAKAEAGDAAARIDLAIVRCDLGVSELFELESALEEGGLALTPEQEHAVEVLRADAAVADTIEVLRKHRDAETRAQAAEEFLAFYRKGTHPAKAGNAHAYWSILADHAVAAQDAAVLRDALAGLRAAGAPGAKLEELAAKLKELEAAR